METLILSNKSNMIVWTEFFKPAVLGVILTHFSTYGGVWPQAFSGQDVAMNYILHKGEVHQIGPITAENKRQRIDERNIPLSTRIQIT